MTIANLTSSSLKSIIKLVEQKEQLLAELDSLKAQLESFAPKAQGSNTATPAARSSHRTRGKHRGRPFGSKNRTSAVKLPKSRPAKAPKAKGGRKGTLKEAVLATLKSTGKPGIHINDFAKKVGSTKNSLNVWLCTNRKKTKELKKLDTPGVWGWEG